MNNDCLPVYWCLNFDKGGVEMTEEWTIGYNEGFMEGWNEAQTETKQLHEANQAMLEALKWIADQTYDPWTNGSEAQRQAIAAIAKAEGMNKGDQQT